MGTVFSFADRFHDSGQWTASERSRLESMTKQVVGDGEALRVAFGATDDGAPWCVLMNEDEEVLVHVARVADQVLAHFVVEDVVAQGATIREALGRWLGPEPERTGIVVPFTRSGGVQNVLVMLAVATFLEDQLQHVASQAMEGAAWLTSKTSGETEVLPSEANGAPEAKPDATPAGEASLDTPVAQPMSSANPDSADEPTARAAPAAATTPPGSGEIAPADAQPAVRLIAKIHGGDGDDILVGTPRAEQLFGGPGDDVLVGGGGRDTLDAGPGDDRIELTAEVVANGGSGADTFVVTAPVVMNRADTLLGTIIDFSWDVGDQLLTSQGKLIISSDKNSFQSSLLPPSRPDADLRVEVDFDGDGKADGYVLILTAAPAQAAAAPAFPSEDIIALAGVSPTWSDFGI